MLYTFLIVFDTLLAIAVVALILINRGQGAEVGAAFGGSSASSSMFGSKGATPFITKVISVLAGLFLLNSLGLAYLVNFQYIQSSVVDKVVTEELQLDQDQVDETGGGEAPGNMSNDAADIPSDIPN